MSGGSLNYAYSSVECAARDIEMRATCPEHRAFATHLRKVAEALHDIEWVFSNDYSEGAEIEAIKACIDRSMIIEVATRDAERAMRELKSTLDSTTQTECRHVFIGRYVLRCVRCGAAKESTAECAHEYTEVATVHWDSVNRCFQNEMRCAKCGKVKE